jgi:hypothetical protein
VTDKNLQKGFGSSLFQSAGQMSDFASATTRLAFGV